MSGERRKLGLFLDVGKVSSLRRQMPLFVGPGVEELRKAGMDRACKADPNTEKAIEGQQNFMQPIGPQDPMYATHAQRGKANEDMHVEAAKHYIQADFHGRTPGGFSQSNDHHKKFMELRKQGAHPTIRTHYLRQSGKGTNMGKSAVGLFLSVNLTKASPIQEGTVTGSRHGEDVPATKPVSKSLMIDSMMRKSHTSGEGDIFTHTDPVATHQKMNDYHQHMAGTLRTNAESGKFGERDKAGLSKLADLHSTAAMHHENVLNGHRIMDSVSSMSPEDAARHGASVASAWKGIKQGPHQAENATQDLHAHMDRMSKTHPQVHSAAQQDHAAAAKHFGVSGKL